MYGNLHYKSMMYYKPTPLFRADVREIAHGLIIRTIRYMAITIYTRYVGYALIVVLTHSTGVSAHKRKATGWHSDHL